MSYNDHAYTRPIEVRGGIRAGSKRGAFGSSWWARRWLQTLEEFRIGTRLDRGRSYARRGQVMSVDVQPGGVTARVQGSRKRPYSVSIEVRTISPPDWERLQEAMAEQPIIAASLLSGRMPDNIEECFRAAGLSMFPDRQDDLETDCSCPDWSNPCKHVAAVYLLLGEEFDRDPLPDLPDAGHGPRGPAGPGVPPLRPNPGWARTARRAPAAGTRGVLVQPADGAAGKGPFRPGRHTRTGCRPAPAAGPVPTLAGQPGIRPGPAGHLPRRLATGSRAPHGAGGTAGQPSAGARGGTGTGRNRGEGRRNLRCQAAGGRTEMTLRPGPPYEWDEDKREDTLRMRGVDFLLVERADWAAAVHLRE